MKSLKYHLRGVFALLSIPLLCSAQLKPADIFTDNVVLQRNHPIHIWGKGQPGAEVKVSLGDDTVVGIIGGDSTWSVHLTKRETTRNPLSMTISSGNSRIKLKNILVGDLWLCIGQSNMEWPMSNEMHFQEALPESNQPLLRFYNPTYASKGIYARPFHDTTLQRMDVANFFVESSWQVSDEETVPRMSAVGYYFGKTVVEETHVPVGLIHLAVGGAPIESFIEPDVLAKDRRFSNKVMGDWLTNPHLPVFARRRGYENVGDGRAIHGDSLGPNHAYKPGFAYLAGVAKVTSLPIAGILWYQGESNAQEKERVDEYVELMKLMVDDYRGKWDHLDLPFYYVQLSSIDTVKYRAQLWPEFRNEQRLALDQIAHSGMAVSSDHGARNNVHPRNKKAVGERLARWALHDHYGMRVIPSGPLPVSAHYKRGKVIVRFKHVGKGLTTAGKGPVIGFALDGHTEVPVEVRKQRVVISSDHKPDFVYYGWRPFTEANLVNSEGLPASTFKVEVE